MSRKDDKVLKVYCHPKCTTCKKAEAWLQDQGIDYNWIDIRQEQPDRDLVLRAIKESSRSRKSFFNTSGKAYRERGIKDQLDGMTDEEAVNLLLSDGMLIKRPFVTDGQRVTSGFKEDQFREVWKG